MPEFENMPTSSEASERDKAPLTIEEIKESGAPEVPEKGKELMEQISAEEKRMIDQTTEAMPIGFKAEVLEAVKQQIQLLKELSQGLKEKINWEKVDKRKALAIGAYAIASIAGGFAATAEAGGTTDDADELTDDQVNSVLRNAVFNELDNIANFTDQDGALFLQTAQDLAEAMNRNNIPNAQVQYSMGIEQMVKWIEYAKSNNINIEVGLQEILKDFSVSEEISAPQAAGASEQGETPQESGGDQTFTDLPESVKLEFDGQYSEVEKMNIQQYYDFTAETVKEVAEEFESWKLKYGYKDNFNDFQSAVSDWINQTNERLKHIVEQVQKPDSKITATSTGNMDPKTAAEMSLDAIDSQVKLRNADEKVRDAFEDME
ncbi:hypothetical protein KJ840_00515 [Patescibacteria group bacterium]|nr:hypothetical protein [Patescibacteria group bacterium]